MKFSKRRFDFPTSYKHLPYTFLYENMRLSFFSLIFMCDNRKKFCSFLASDQFTRKCYPPLPFGRDVPFRLSMNQTSSVKLLVLISLWMTPVFLLLFPPISFLFKIKISSSDAFSLLSQCESDTSDWVFPNGLKT